MRTAKSADIFLSRMRGFLEKLLEPPQFTCGDCESSARCGLPPNELCLVKARHLASGDWQTRRRYRALARTIGPM